MKPPFELILREIEKVLSQSDYTELEDFVQTIFKSKVIVCYGAGRVGLMMKSFTKRLSHLGMEAYFLEDSSVPRLSSQDLLIIGSSSGSTRSVVVIAEIAHSLAVPIIAIGANHNSPISRMAQKRIVLGCLIKKDLQTEGVNSVQPMTSLFEQSLLILLDSVILLMMNLLGENAQNMRLRHNVLE